MSFHWSSETPDKLLKRLRDADALMAKNGEEQGMFRRESPQWYACARRFWHEKARDLPVHFNARAHYIELLEKSCIYYESKNAVPRILNDPPLNA